MSRGTPPFLLCQEKKSRTRLCRPFAVDLVLRLGGVCDLDGAELELEVEGLDVRYLQTTNLR